MENAVIELCVLMMASVSTNAATDSKPDVNGASDSCKNDPDEMTKTTKQNETLKENQSSDNNGSVEEAVNKEVTPGESKPIEDLKNEKNARESSQEAANGSIPKKSRRVYFIDDRIVSGYMDPPNPWHEGRSTSAFFFYHAS